MKIPDGASSRRGIAADSGSSSDSRTGSRSRLAGGLALGAAARFGRRSSQVGRGGGTSITGTRARVTFTAPVVPLPEMTAKASPSPRERERASSTSLMSRASTETADENKWHSRTAGDGRARQDGGAAPSVPQPAPGHAGTRSATVHGSDKTFVTLETTSAHTGVPAPVTGLRAAERPPPSAVERDLRVLRERRREAVQGEMVRLPPR